MSYKIKDLQFNGEKYFADETIYKNKKEVCEALINFHEYDCDMSVEKKLLKQEKINACWNELSYFEWELEKV